VCSSDLKNFKFFHCVLPQISNIRPKVPCSAMLKPYTLHAIAACYRSLWFGYRCFERRVAAVRSVCTQVVFVEENIGF